MRIGSVLCIAMLAACGKGPAVAEASMGIQDGSGSGSGLGSGSGTGGSMLGAHTLLTQDQQQGTRPATTAPITTQASHSILLALSMGQSFDFATPTDTFHNNWVLIGHQNPYAGGSFSTQMWAALSAAGGGGHTISTAKPGDPIDEISFAFIEVANASIVKEAIYAYPFAGMPNTAGTVNTDGPATLIAVWGGDGPDLSNTAVPSDGFQIVDSYLALGPTSGVQVAIAVKQVSAAGAYTTTWTATPVQGAACYLIAIE